MDINELKKKATAAELCLIEKVEGMVEAEIFPKLQDKLITFIESNLPPSIEDCRFNPVAGKMWSDRLRDFMLK